ncbi:hypothetical protein NSS64_15670 [Paenibacillus sp. FSL H8-0122]|uniref:hypothetical protein n=1 Tax=Paenibacillus sp. FSL H8-0122 TaxID=2954510 RepID=UPI0030FA83DE
MDKTETENFNLENDFRDEALFIIDSLQICIDNFGFSESLRKEIDIFFEQEHSIHEEDISGKIAGIYMAFLGKTDFKNKESTSNKELLSQLKKEIAEVRELLND